MQKSVHTREYRLLLELLRDTRQQVGMTQVELADRVGESQSFISKCERGELRLDLVQLRGFCQSLGITLTAFVKKYEQRVASRK